MKTKTLLWILFIVVIFLAYNVFCYSFLTSLIKKNTSNIIVNYLDNVCNSCEYELEYKKILSSDSNTISIYLEVNSESDLLAEYYEFELSLINNNYYLKSVTSDIPNYLKF